MYIFSGIFYFKMSKSAFRSVIHATFSQKLAGNFKNKKVQYFPLFLWKFGMAAGGLELTTARIRKGRYASTATADL